MPETPQKPISASLEDYLEAIYNIIQEKHGVKAIEVSRKLGVGRSSVTEALKTLAEKKLVNYGRYDVLSLTPLGEKTAKGIILRHNVLHDFFTKVLGLSSETADIDACKVEHVVSEETMKHFISFMEYHKQILNGDNNHIKNFINFHQNHQKR